MFLATSRPAPSLRFALLAVALTAVSCSAKLETGGGTATAAASDTVATAEHGAYIVTIAGCHDCHTPGFFYNAPDFNRALSGSEIAWVGPWGTSYARNLTPDMETGIGAWSEDDIVHALQTGMRPDGTTLNPPMPWPNFARMTPKDVHSVAKYLKSLPPIKHINLPILPPGRKPGGSVVHFPPPPSAWDMPKTP
jgi:mono/diheme cytochrome c family protein